MNSVETFIPGDNSFYVRNKYWADSFSALSTVKSQNKKERNVTYVLACPSVMFSSGGVTPRLSGTAPPLPEAMAALPTLGRILYVCHSASRYVHKHCKLRPRSFR